MYKIVKGVITGVLFFMAQNALAQGPPINTDTPIMLGLEGSGLRSFVKIVHKSVQNGAADTPTVTAVFSPLIIPVNLFSDKFQTGVIIPFKSVTLTTGGGTNRNRGIGDARVYAKYLLFQQDGRNETFRIAAKTVFKFPSGNERLSPGLGSGTTDVIFSTVAGWIKHRSGMYLETQYALNGTHNGLNAGDAFLYNLAFVYRLLPVIYNHYPMNQLNLLLEINGLRKFADTGTASTVANGGGSRIFISPGIQFSGGAHWLIESSFQYPLLNNWANIQLKEDWTVSSGFRYLFDF